MKKYLWFCLVFMVTISLSYAQEWMSSLDVAKRLARVQNKMVFAMWEDSTIYPYPVHVRDDKGKLILTDLFEDETINRIIWEHFVPVKISESFYDDLYKPIKGKRSSRYIEKFNDDSIKIMDVNGNILNIYESISPILDIAKFIDKYALKTIYLNQYLVSYYEQNNFNTSIRLALKYYDLAIFNDKGIKKELISLANIYMDQAKNHLAQDDHEDKLILSQKCELYVLESDLILNKPKKVLRYLKKMEAINLDDSNLSLYAFLHYTAFQMLKQDKKAVLWKSQVSLVDLEKAQLIINSTK